MDRLSAFAKSYLLLSQHSVEIYKPIFFTRTKTYLVKLNHSNLTQNDELQ